MNRTPKIDETPTGRKSRAHPIPDLSDEASLFCILHDMEMHELIQYGRRDEELVNLRHKFYYEIASTTDYPLMSLGRALGRDHTTILWGITRHARLNGLSLPRGMHHPRDRFFKSNWRPHWWKEGTANAS